MFRLAVRLSIMIKVLMPRKTSHASVNISWIPSIKCKFVLSSGGGGGILKFNSQ